MTAVMVEYQQRSYTPDEFRELLKRLYGPGSDWELAGEAAPDFNTDQGSVYRWLKGKYRVKGTTAAVAYLLWIHSNLPK